MKETNEIQMLAKTLFGLEGILTEELQRLGASNIVPLNRAVQFTGNLALLYKANLHLRTALKILIPLKSFQARDQHGLYKNIKTIDWTKYLNNSNSFIIRPVVYSNYFSHSKFVAQKAKDAIVDQLRDEQGNRPSINADDPDLVIDLHIAEDTATVSLDSSGSPLNQRAYRKSGGEAPLNEILASAMILMSKWDGKTTFIDPMCGSGTLLIEAAMIASNHAPNLLRKEYAFMRWGNFDKKLWTQIYTDAKNSVRIPDKKELKILGSDISLGKLEIAQRNIGQAGFTKLINLRNKPFDQFIAPSGGGILIFNPPYGERIKVKQIDDLYTYIGDTLKKNWTGFEAWILSSNMEALKHIGLKPNQKTKLFNGKLECQYVNYTVFEGKRADYLENMDSKITAIED
jgi:putative N6-adenine-specific DNA methylase